MGLHSLPYAGLVGAVGVTLLLLTASALGRAAGALLFLVGAAPLAWQLQNGVVAKLEHRPLVAVLGGAGLLAAGILGVVAAARWPHAVVATALVVGLRFPLSSNPRPLQHLAPMYAVLACGLGGLVWRSMRRSARPPNRLGVVGVGLAGVVAVAALSMLWTVDVEKGAYALVAYYLPLGALAALVGALELSPRHLARLAGLQLAVASVLAVVAVYQWETRHLFSNEKLILTNEYVTFFRVNSLIFDPSLFGRFEMLALITAVALLALAPPARVLVAGAVAIPLIGAGLFLTYSQSSLVALVVGMLAIAGLAWPRRTLVGFVVLVAVLGVGGFLLPQTRSTLTASPNKLSSGRLDLAERGGHAFVDHPLQGVGLGGYATAASPDGKHRSKLAPHNVFVETASELGLVGLAALVAFAVTIVQALRVPREGVAQVVRAVLALELGALFVHSLAYDTFFEDPLVWAIAAMIAVGATAARAQATPEPAPEAAT